MMQKLIAIVVATMFAFALTGCGNGAGTAPAPAETYNEYDANGTGIPPEEGFGGLLPERE